MTSDGHRILRAAGALAASLALGSCAELLYSPEECGVGAERAGYRDGANGLDDGYGRLNGYCAEIGAVPDREAYLAGYEEGLRRYCSPRNGYWLGWRDSVYRGVCPPELEPAFQNAYRQGFMDRILWEDVQEGWPFPD